MFVAPLQCPDHRILNENFGLLTSLQFLLGILISMAYLSSFLINISSIIAEKSTKAKEYLRLMGARSSVLTFSWIIKSHLLYVLVSIAFTIILKMEFKEISSSNQSGSLMPNTCYMVIFLVLHTFSLQLNLLSILMGQIFDKCKCLIMFFRRKRQTT